MPLVDVLVKQAATEALVKQLLHHVFGPPVSKLKY